MKYAVLGSIIFFAFTTPLSAQVIISEIMYDLPGSDSGREWIEIENIGAEEVDLSGWKFFEANTNHGLNLISGSALIPASGFAIIADNAEKFLIDWPGFSGTLFDSSFSLKNDSETIAIRDGELNEIDSVTYSSEWGAAGDGQTLNRNGNDWQAASPTPGGAAEFSLDGDTEAVGDSEQAPSSSGGATPLHISKIKTEIIKYEKVIMAGSSAVFAGEVYGLDDEPIDNARLVWTFGDGAIAEGNNIFHTYYYPGEYRLVLDAASGEYSASDSVKITVIEPAVFLSSFSEGPDGFAQMTNESNFEINVSFWIVRDGNNSFSIPQNTFILPQGSTKIAALTAGFSFSKNTILLYPNGVEVNLSENRNASDLNQGSGISKKTENILPTQSPSLDFDIPKDIAENDSLIVSDDRESETVLKGSSSSNQELSAAAGLSVPKNDNQKTGGVMGFWLAALSGLILVSVVSLLLIKNPGDNSPAVSAEDIEILE